MFTGQVEVIIQIAHPWDKYDLNSQMQMGKENIKIEHKLYNFFFQKEEPKLVTCHFINPIQLIT